VRLERVYYGTVWILRCLAVVLIVSSAGAQTASNPFGLMVPWAWQQPDKAAKFAESMHVKAYRPLSIFMDRDLLCAECQTAREHKLDLVITVRANGGAPGNATSPPKDLIRFKQDVQAVAAKWQPLVLIIENEPNSRLFYNGTAAQYLMELKAGCEAAHAVNVPCADGGLTSRAVAALTVKSYLAAGKSEAALNLARRTLGVARINDVTELQRLLERFSPQLTLAEQLLRGFADAGADYVNFHWYESGAQALRQAVEYLKGATGLPVITNEIGQRNDYPAETTAKLQTALDLGLELVVWYSNDGPNSRALANADGSLRHSGEAFQQFMNQHFPATAATR
jgi:hypothetical protein